MVSAKRKLDSSIPKTSLATLMTPCDSRSQGTGTPSAAHSRGWRPRTPARKFDATHLSAFDSLQSWRT